jgi:hypothetical protein
MLGYANGSDDNSLIVPTESTTRRVGMMVTAYTASPGQKALREAGGSGLWVLKAEGNQWI